MSTELPIERARRQLNETFGYASFRPGQSEAISAVLNGQDVVAVMPTGGGKSLCYQIPALQLPHVTLVVSPLIALMRDQVDRLLQRGVRAAAIHSGMEQGSINNVIAEVARGEVQLLYVAPERLESTTFRRQLSTVPLSLLAVDEAHCISEWGHDFRPSYQSIATLFDERPRVPILAVTATATPDVRQDIVRSLKLQRPVEIVRGFDRPNLAFSVVDTPFKVEHITQMARTFPNDIMIVYCGSRKRVESTAEDLQRRGLRAEAYHAGLADAVRGDVQDRFLDGTIKILVATNAFGMGVDKADVRHVIHTDFTLTLEAYYQEAGRAGRDGAPSTCTLLVQQEDRRLMDFFIESSYPAATTIQAVYHHLYERLGIGVGQGAGNTLMADASSIGAALTLPVITVNGVLTMLERAGAIVRTSQHGTARIRLRTSVARLNELATRARPERAAVLDALVRRIGGRGPDDHIDIEVGEMLRRSGATINEFAETMAALQQSRLITYTPPAAQGSLTILANRDRQAPIDLDDLRRRREHAQQKFDVMIRYAAALACKRNFILNHFGDPSIDGVCGRCSSCNGVTQAPPLTDRQLNVVMSVIRTAYQLGGRFGKQVIADVLTGTATPRIQQYSLDRCDDFGAMRTVGRREILDGIDAALARNYIAQASGMYPVLGTTDEGARFIGRLPRQIAIEWQRRTASPALIAALREARERWALRDGATGSALASLEELEQIAVDSPQTRAELIPGRHGSAAFIERYGDDVIRVIIGDGVKAVPKTIIDPEILRLVELVTPGATLRDVARQARATPAAAAHALERAVRSGVLSDRGSLVSDELYEQVANYLRYHRRSGMRDVINQLGGDVDLPALRVAIALVRRNLYNE
jgi:ATP-dependent DNA helicase RecQ